MQTGSLRPLSFGEILDGAFVLYRRHFAEMARAALIPLLPIVLGWLWLAWRGVPEPLWILGLGFGAMVPAVFAKAALVRLGAAAYAGPQHAQSSSAWCVGNYLALLATVLVARLFSSIAYLFLIMPGLLLTAHYALIYPAMVIEGHRGSRARARSGALSEGATWQVLGLLLVGLLIVWLPSLPLTEAARLYARAGSRSYYLSQALSMTFQALALPLRMGIITLLYFDRRVRTEALDVQLAAHSLPSLAATA
jgi:hypothetical protein